MVRAAARTGVTCGCVIVALYALWQMHGNSHDLGRLRPLIAVDIPIQLIVIAKECDHVAYGVIDDVLLLAGNRLARAADFEYGVTVALIARKLGRRAAGR